MRTIPLMMMRGEEPPAHYWPWPCAASQKSAQWEAALIQVRKVESCKKVEHTGNFKKHKCQDKKVAHDANSNTQQSRLLEID